MARKRLNVKFLVLGLGPVLLLGGILVAWKVVPKVYPQARWWIHGKPEEHAAKAKAFFDQGKYDDAVEAYRFALYLKSEADAPWYTALADSYSHLILESQENRDQAIRYYQAALGSDPNYVPALERMLEWREAEAEMISGPRAQAAWKGVELDADKILAVDPKHRKARTARLRAILSQWQVGTDITDEQVDQSITALLELAEEPPFDADAVFYVMQAQMNRVQRHLNRLDHVGARPYLDYVMQLVTRSLEQYPNDGLLHFRCAMAYRGMGLAERSPGQPPKYLEESLRELRLAAELIKPDHPMYTDIRVYYGKQLESEAQTLGTAEQMYRQMLAERPTEMAVRVALAELLSRNPNTQLEAIKWLEDAPPPDLTRYFGVRALLARRYEFTALYDLVNIKLDILPRLRGQPGYDAMLQQVEDSFKKLTAIPGVADSPLALQSRGRIELAKGQNYQAVQTLERALKVMPVVNSGPEAESRYRLMFFLAGAYVLTNQTGEAKTYLTTIVQDVPQLANARLMLAQLLLQENKIDEARPHVDWLSKNMPGESRVIRMVMRTLDKEKDKAQLLELWQKLPQETAEQINEKAQAAIYIDHRDEAVRLLEELRQARPTDATVRVSLARVHSEMGNKPQALELMDEALRIHPENAQLKMIRAEIAGADMAIIRQEIIDTLPPLDKALALYQLAVQEDRPEDARRFLDEAIALNPNNGRVIELVFNRAVIQRDWATAQEAVDKLARLNHDAVDGRLYRIRLYLAKGELDQAANQANELVKRMAEFAPSYVVLGQVQKAQKKYIDAIQSFQTALSKDARQVQALRELIEISYITNNPPQALTYIAQARQLYPTFIPFKEQELAHELKYGNPEKVLEPREAMLKEAIEKKDPGELRQWLALGNTYVAVARSKDSPQAGRPFLEKARDTFTQAMAKFPDDMQLVDRYSDVQLQLRAPAEGERAIIALRDRETWKNKPEPTILLAGYYGRAGDAAKQEKVLRDYLAAAPASVPVQLDLSLLLSRQDKLDEALKVLDINADVPEIRRQRIELQIAANRLPDAERELKTAMDAAATPSSMLLNRQAYILIKSDRATEALAVLGRSLAQSPNDMEALFLQGSIYLQARRNLPTAISNLEAARDNGFKPLEARLLLSEAYRFNRDDEASIRELEETVRLFPEDKRPRLMLVKAYGDASPPDWVQAERAIRDAKNQPKFANDPEFANAEAGMWLLRRSPQRAATVLVEAMRANPEDQNLFRTYLQAAFESRDYQRLIQVTDAMTQAKKAPWWVYQYRGRARRAMEDRRAALTEFETGLDVAWAANDDSASAVILNSIATDIGIPVARGLITERANQQGGYRWQLMMSHLSGLENDYNTAITWAERVANDQGVTPEYLGSARRQLGMLYLRTAPPQVSKAVNVYRQLIQQAPEDIVSLNNLASAMILPDSGHTAQEALVYSERAYRLVTASENTNPQVRAMRPYIYDTHGQVLVLAGNSREGILLLQQAMDQEPIPDACLHLGEAYLKLSEPRILEAQDVLKQGLALVEALTRDNQPVDPEVKSKLEKALQQAEQMSAARAAK